jgi:Tfp pilus assembly protein PilF
MNHPEALRLASDGAACAESGDLNDAEDLFRRALAQADPRDPSTGPLHQEYAMVLARLGREYDAGPHYERAVALALKAHGDESNTAVVVARYFLGEHYLRMGDADSARRVVASSLEASPTSLAWMVEAQALHLAGSATEARAAGDRALELADNDGQRDQIRERLAEVWAT